MKRISAVLLSLLMIFTLSAFRSNVTNQQVTITIDNNQQRTGLYTGEMENNVPDGKGVFSAMNNQNTNWIYEGQFRKGTLNGQGKTTWPSINKTAEGIYENGEIRSGKMISSGHLVYDGEWKNELPNGQGTYYNQNGAIVFKGEFKNGLPSLPPVALNQPVSYRDWQYQAVKVSTAASFGKTLPKGIFVIIDMHVTNNGTGGARQFSWDSNPFALIDGTGKRYPMDTNAMCVYYGLSGARYWYLSQIAPSASADLPLIFDVPVGSPDTELLPLYGIGKAAPIRIGTIRQE